MMMMMDTLNKIKYPYLYERRSLRLDSGCNFEVIKFSYEYAKELDLETESWKKEYYARIDAGGDVGIHMMNNERL